MNCDHIVGPDGYCTKGCGYVQVASLGVSQGVPVEAAGPVKVRPVDPRYRREQEYVYEYTFQRTHIVDGTKAGTSVLDKSLRFMERALQLALHDDSLRLRRQLVRMPPNRVEDFGAHARVTDVH